MQVSSLCVDNSADRTDALINFLHWSISRLSLHTCIHHSTCQINTNNAAIWASSDERIELTNLASNTLNTEKRPDSSHLSGNLPRLFDDYLYETQKFHIQRLCLINARVQIQIAHSCTIHHSICITSFSCLNLQNINEQKL